MIKKLLFLFTGIVFGYLISIRFPYKASVQNIPKNTSDKSLDTVSILETSKGKVYILTTNDGVYFQPFEIADTPYQSISVKKTDYPKLFMQGVANSSFIIAEIQDESENPEVLLTNNQPDHGGYSPTYSLLVNPFTEGIQEQ